VEEEVVVVVAVVASLQTLTCCLGMVVVVETYPLPVTRVSTASL
jgi:hypothetical protein